MDGRGASPERSVERMCVGGWSATILPSPCTMNSARTKPMFEAALDSHSLILGDKRSVLAWRPVRRSDPIALRRKAPPYPALTEGT
jgi:hypothetical protein